MNYYLYKLRFTTPLHIGNSDSARSGETATETICADTLFSALCHASLQCYAQEGLNKLVALFQSSDLRLSDAFPYDKESLYIPKPYLKINSKTTISDYKMLKQVKNMKYIRIDQLAPFISGFLVSSENGLPMKNRSFTKSSSTTRVNMREEQSFPYQIHAVHFEPGCGLYGIIQYSEEAHIHWLKPILETLGLSGIGGKTSSGYGKYILEDSLFLDTPIDEQTTLLTELLHHKQANRYISLTTALPKDNELEDALTNASYGMKRRGGFVFAPHTKKPLKKQTQYFFSSGSVFHTPFDGDLWTVAETENHPVYRYGKPIFLGVNL